MELFNDTELLKLLKKEYPRIDIGLLNGKAGLSLYYAYLSSKDLKFEKTYRLLISDLLTSVSKRSPIGFSDGLIGISVAIELILYYYKKGNPERVLEDVIPEIYKSFDLDTNIKINSNLMTEGLFFFTFHLKYGVRSKAMRMVIANKAVSLLEFVYAKKMYLNQTESMPGQILTKEFFFFIAICELYKQGFYKERIIHICNELIYELFSSIPAMQFNRVVRKYLVAAVRSTIHNLVSSWGDYSELLSQIIAYDKLSDELSDKQICLNDGFGGLILLLTQIDSMNNNKFFSSVLSKIANKIEKTKICYGLEEGIEIPRYYLGLNGIWGVKYVMERFYQT